MAITIPIQQGLINFHVRGYNQMYEENIEYCINRNRKVVLKLNDINYGHDYGPNWVWQNNWKRLNHFLEYMNISFEDLTAMKNFSLYFGISKADETFNEVFIKDMKKSGVSVHTEILDNNE